MRIVQTSDTHLGKRPKNTRSNTINQEIRPLEDDYYVAWERFIESVCNVELRPDIILHCGDLYDSPSLANPYPPPERARIVVTETLKKIRKLGIPIVIIDGNHGRYDNLRDSTISVLPKIFDNVHIFTYYDIRDAIKLKQPLFIDFEHLNLRVFAHPFINLNGLPSVYNDLYEEWITIQNSQIRTEGLNIAIAHGNVENKTLSTNFLKGNYDYIALGDVHKNQQVRDNIWYSGSLEMCSFSEFGYDRGYLLIDIEKNRTLQVNPINLLSRRRIINEKIELKPSFTNTDLISIVIDLLQKHELNKNYDYSSASRVRIVFNGRRTIGDYYNLSEVESYLKSIVLDSVTFNVVEFIIESPNIQHSFETHQSILPNDQLHLVDDAEKEFQEYITDARTVELENQNIDSQYLSKLFVNMIRKEDVYEDFKN